MHSDLQFYAKKRVPTHLWGNKKNEKKKCNRNENELYAYVEDAYYLL